MSKDKVLDFDHDLSQIGTELEKIHKRTADLKKTENENSDSLAEIKQMLKHLGAPEIVDSECEIDTENYTVELNQIIKDIDDPMLRGDITLSANDVIVSIIAGIIASIIDIVFVGTPEVVKIYRGGENFDRSVFTKALRSLGNGDDRFSEMLHWLSDKFTVPYDISALTDTVNPNNHRLRSFAHDPMIGLLFAIVDIIMGTATVIDNSGHIRVIVRPQNYPENQKYLAVIYYLGHLLSDVCTARGLPIPGFILTQFFTSDDGPSLASVAEEMYKDGYDLRHLASMSTPVFVKNLITDSYLGLVKLDNPELVKTIAEREIDQNKKDIYKYKLRLVSDAVSCGGNVMKFFIPPTLGNMTALNLPEWISLIKDTIINLKYQFRDKNVEQVMFNREIISDNWNKLQNS